MLRLFKIHEVRISTELECLWDFTVEENKKTVSDDSSGMD